MKARHVGIVWKKELTDGLRDRRSLLAALAFPLVGPLLVVLMFKLIADREAVDQPVPLPIVGAEHAPALVEWLGHHDIEVQPPPDDRDKAVKSGDVPAVLVIGEDYPKRFREARPAPLELLVDNSRQDGRSKVRRVQRALEAYGAEIGAMRLLVRGIDPKLASPVAVAEVDLATPQQVAANILNMVPMFVMLAAFIGGLYVATDATAGERERGSLEPLLSNPVDRTSLALGKWLATCVLASVSMMLTLFGTGIALGLAPLEDIGLDLHMTAGMALSAAILVLPVGLLAAGMQLVIATFARSFREAQTYLSVLTFVPMVPGMLMAFSPMDASWWSMLVPIVGSQVELMNVVKGEPVTLLAYVVPAVVATVLALVCVRVTAWLLGREKIVFGG